ncbi:MULTISPECIES: HBL/NHE enterotoxin family protein [Bacillus]|uniref:HBL/NHE enterotoxin family protein n=1 Tax=Bacillus TaxID=1386 RepID=UPI000BEE0BE2|nr:HBL/NHE enterotoxin family protein [Bacillus thuringiensis]EKS8366961.1 HBL/NHE enterotoxin family protein [Bacillus cereus]EKS8372933.1 HBL/NHE enterotoxin family protein [Bacillus cereus]MBG9492379.1 hemolysin BL lytic component L1 [Bacillus thuringiensis]MBG9503515.1 hemolysin BL lytic component L1 [Bacillus thuringiensis]MBG9504687.1 hemolysin BL lytic component L1 [Bacillus thuringiensis]
MKKMNYKVLTLATLATIMGASQTLPLHTFAQEKVVQKEDKYQLGPEGIKTALAETGSHIIAMNLYANTMLKQPDINLSDLSLGAEGDVLKDNIKKHQITARSNATYWFDKAKPQIHTVANGIVNYNAQFQEYYTTLVDAAKTGATETIKEGLEDFCETLSENADKADKVITMLNEFKGKLYNDTAALRTDVDGTTDTIGLTTLLAGNNALIPQLKKEVEELESVKNQHFKDILGWGIGGGVGTVVLLGGAIGGGVAIVVTGGTATPLVIGGLTALTAAGIGLGTASGVMLANHFKAHDDAADKIHKLNAQADQAQQAIISLTAAKANLTTLYQTVDQAISSLTEMKKQWTKMSTNYKILIENVDNMDSAALSLLEDDLAVAQKEWQNIYEKTVQIIKDMPQKEETR